jgi:hypothetical protein
MDLEAMRTALHDAVDEIIDDYLTREGAPPQSTAQPPPMAEIVTWSHMAEMIVTWDDVVSRLERDVVLDWREQWDQLVALAMEVHAHHITAG